MLLKNTLLLTFSLFFILGHAQKVEKEIPSSWVIPSQIISTEETQKDGAYNYLLLDFQDNLILEEEYVHYAIELLNSEGIQEFSDITISFDPTFQKLTFHCVNIYRNGQKIDKLTKTKINTFQRETNLERNLYDGSLTAILNLPDIRVGDVIEYSYTRKGFNPINKGNYSSVYYQQYTSAVEKINHRIITDSSKPIQVKPLNGAQEPTIKKTAGIVEYTWNISGTDYYKYDTNSPYWMDFKKRVSISTFTNWENLNNLLVPLYEFDKNLKFPSDIDKNIDDEEQRILQLIRFVQDDIRYLGFEGGIGAYKPHNPKKVLAQRYGDCKDKSLLLANLLQNEGVNAYPLLVNTEMKGEFAELLPGLNLFDHCIVHFEFRGQDYHIDPTVKNQGGDLKNISLPKYDKGLLIKPGTTTIINLRKQKKLPKIKIEETINNDSIGGNAIFLIKSTYTGSRADYMRDYFKSNTLDNIKNEFINYYSSIYPSIEATQDVRYIDNQRNGINEVVVEEYYNVNLFWAKDEETGIYSCSSEPLVLESMIEYTSSPSRKSPYYLGSPFSYEQNTNIRLPEYWDIDETNFTQESESFNYKSQVKTIGKTISINHKYELKKEFIEPKKVASFISKHEKINNQISYELTHPGNVLDASNKTNWMSYLLSILFVVLGTIIAAKVYEKYNPKVESVDEIKSIGGWLILPAIGLVLTPFVLIFQIAVNGYFESGLWSSFKILGYDNWWALNLLMGAEFAINVFLLVFSILLIILFFQKRTSLPKLIVVFYIISALTPIYDYVMYSELFPKELLADFDDTESFGDIFKSIIRAAIWIPYFMISDRVKKTFVNQNDLSRKKKMILTD